MIATMTAGDCGSSDYGPVEIAAIRKREAANAASLIGAQYRCLSFGDLAVFNDDASRRRVCAVLREERPDIVLTASPVDYHCDHEAAAVLVRDACFAASVPNYRVPGSSAPPLPAIPHLYFMDSVEALDRDGKPIRPDTFIDIEEVFEKKKEMLACHESQRAWLRAQHGIDDFLSTMENWTRSVGQRCGVKYAEGFRRYPGHPYPQTPLLEELVLDYVVRHRAIV